MGGVLFALLAASTKHLKEAFKADPSLRGCGPLFIVKGMGQQQVCEVAGYRVPNKVLHPSKTVLRAGDQSFQHMSLELVCVGDSHSNGNIRAVYKY